MIAEIITIGDEILIGQIIDSNSSFIAQELNKIGISVNQILSIQDNKEQILTTLKESNSRVQLVIVTGGLGPTKDDITKITFCDYFEDELIVNKDVLHQVEEIFKKITTSKISDLNRKQAMVPSKAQILQNKYGTAPGMWLEKDGTVFISLPGVPFEMKKLMKGEVIPKLISEFDRPFIYHKTLRTYGLGESALSERIAHWEDNLPAHIKLAYLPNLGTVRLRLSGKDKDEMELKNSIDGEFEKILPTIKDLHVNFEIDGANIVDSINTILQKTGKTISFAESCTGGRIASEYTSRPGVSASLKGSIVSYSTEVKVDQLKVSASDIEKYSVVSEEIAIQMANNCRKIFKTDYAIATTGTAGPDKGESEEKIGTVFIAIAMEGKVITEKFIFGHSREQVIKKAVNKSFEMILKELTSEE